MELSTLELKLLLTGLESLKRIVTGAELNQLRQRIESHLKLAQCNCGGSKIDPEHIEAQPCKCEKESFHITDSRIKEAVKASINPGELK